MNCIYMIRIETYFGEKVKDYSFSYEGAFKSFRSASEWLINKGYEAFFDYELSKLFGKDIIRFISRNKPDEETYIGHITEYGIKE